MQQPLQILYILFEITLIDIMQHRTNDSGDICRRTFEAPQSLSYQTMLHW
jgi:hypothetical protein